jgi:3-keto-5-aminohexanoate cleavage enzyme
MAEATSPPPLIINLAGTGMVPTKADNSAVPITPEEIAEDCARCHALGVSIFHLHARDEAGAPTWRPEVYRRIVLGVRARCPDAILCVSTSGRNFKRFEERSAVLELDGDARPDMASLTLGSLNFPSQASVNEPAMIKALAEKMAARGIVPELEVFDFGMLDYGKFLIERGILRPPYYFNLLLGSLGTLSATPFHLSSLVRDLPAAATSVTWAGAGIGRYQFFVNSLAVTMGGHVRVGLEDNLFLDPGKERPASNPALVERLVRLAEALGRPVATPQQARAMIGLPAEVPA